MSADHHGPSVAQQVAAGRRVGSAGPEPSLTCDACGDALAEGQLCGATLSRPVETPEWVVSGVYCADCDADAHLAPSLGVEDVAVTAWVALRSLPAAREHSHVLAQPSIVRYHGPETGGDA